MKISITNTNNFALQDPSITNQTFYDCVRSKYRTAKYDLAF